MKYYYTKRKKGILDFNFFSNVRNSRQAELIFKFRSGLRLNDKENTIEFEHT